MYIHTELSIHCAVARSMDLPDALLQHQSEVITVGAKTRVLAGRDIYSYNFMKMHLTHVVKASRQFVCLAMPLAYQLEHF